VYTKKTQVTSEIFHGIPERALHSYFTHHDIENTVANTIYATYARRRTMERLGALSLNKQRLSCILIDFFTACYKIQCMTSNTYRSPEHTMDVGHEKK